MEKLIRLAEDFEQSPWLDNITRSYLTSGRLAELRDGGVRGLTSNPSIFQNSIQGSSDYDAQLRILSAEGNQTIDDYWSLVIDDIDGACDVFEPVFSATDGLDGYVSVEVDPRLAHDTSATEVAARTLHERLARRNLMVKIPGTAEGTPAIRQMIAEGRNINVTLIFSLDGYQAVMDAYLEGLEAFAKNPDADLSQVASVASFFISRVDTEVDRRLEAIGTEGALSLRGTAAVAQARLAYQQFKDTFSGPRWQALAARGARVQRPLWASTSTKNPAYSDTLYVDELIGPHTVNTLPEPTLQAFADHGTLERRLDGDIESARRVWSELAQVGVNKEDVAAVLEEQGIAAFISSFEDLLDVLEGTRNRVS